MSCYASTIGLLHRIRNALRALISLSKQVDPSQIDALQRDLDALVDPRQQAAIHLSMPAESLEIGPNLLANPGFEMWPADGEPYGWEPLDVSRLSTLALPFSSRVLSLCALDGATSVAHRYPVAWYKWSTKAGLGRAFGR